MFKRLAWSAVLLLAACGGGGGGNGGGGSGGGLQLSLAPSPLDQTLYQWDLPQTETVVATVTGSANASTYYVLVADNGGLFQSGQVQIAPQGNNAYQAQLTVPTGTASGAHTGTLQVRVCADPQCASVLGSSTLPYTVTVQPNPTLTGSAAAPLQGTASSQAQTGAMVWTAPLITLQGNAVFPVYANLTDANGLVTMPTGTPYNSSSMVGPINGNSFQLEVQGGAALAAGSYQGTVQLTLCHDAACKQVFQGSSSIPYQITVADSRLTPLSAAAGVADWGGEQGSAARNGYAPLTVDAAKLAPRWLYLAPNASDELLPADPVTYQGKVFVHTQGVYLLALDENDGSQAIWGDPNHLVNGGPAAIADGTLYMNGDDTSGGGNFLYAVNAADGHLQFSTLIQNGGFKAPVAQGGQAMQLLYNNGYSWQSFSAQNTTGTAPACLQAQEQDGFAADNTMVPAMDAALNAYFPTRNGLLEAGFGSGACALIAAGPFETGFVGAPLLVPGGSHVLMVSGSGLTDYDSAAQKVLWNLAEPTLQPDPALANGVIYVASIDPFPASAPRLEAHSEADGHLLWSWAPLAADEQTPVSGVAGNVLVTNNLVLYSSLNRTYAIDLTTHQLVATLNTPGQLAVSANGLLYGHAGGGNGALAAVNLH